MRKWHWCIVAVIAAAAPARADDSSRAWAPPTRGEATILAAAEGLIVADVAISVRLLRRPGSFEANPFLGEHPSALGVVATGACGGLLLAALWYALPPRARWIAPLFVGIGESVVLANSIGMALRL